MAPKYEPAWQIYKEEMDSWCHGHALWQPSPTDYERINIGDVGYILEGRFHLLFSATRSRETQRGRKLPDTFEKMQWNENTDSAPCELRDPGCLHGGATRIFGMRVGVSTSAAIPSAESDTSFSYTFTGERGAALVTRYQTYREYTVKRGTFKQYTKQHYQSWVAFAREEGYGDDIEPVLVYAVDMTKDFAMAAYSKESSSLEGATTVSVPMFISASASAWGSWSGTGKIHVNRGPQQRIPPSPTQDVGSSSQTTTTRAIPYDHNQCVFIRYYTVRSRVGLFPRVMKAAAGPHDPGSGKNRDSTFPELTARPDLAPDVGCDLSDHEAQNLGPGDDGSEQNVVVDNIPDGKEYDEFDAIADYVFQNSDARFVLMHHGDLEEIHKVGGVNATSFLLDRDRPRIEVDESGVGTIVFGDDLSQQLVDPVTTFPHQFPTPPSQDPGDSNYQKISPTLDATVGTSGYPDNTKNLKGQDADPRSSNPPTPPLGITTNFEPQTLSGTTHDPVSHSAATTVSNTSIEAKHHGRNPGNPEPEVTTQTSESHPPTWAPNLSPDEDLGLIEGTVHPVLVGRSVAGEKVARDNSTFSPSPSPHHDPLRGTDNPPDPSVTVDSHEQALQRLISHTVPQEELPSLIREIFSDGNAADMIDRLQERDAQAFIDITDGVLDSLDLESHTRRSCMELLYEACAHHSLVPRSLQIGLCYNPASAPHSHGGFADVWKGEYRGLEVAVKVLRIHVSSDLKKITRGFCKEFVTWKALRHPNVLPLLGVMMTNDLFAMVSEWMINGNINQFVMAYRDANRFELLGDVARGLVYIHDQGMVHGDLKGANILVDQSCKARLADFGLLSVTSDSTMSSHTQGGTTRWMSPELFDPETQDHRPTKDSDCYALGMVIYEVLGERIPFYQYPNLMIPGKVIGGDRPERPQGTEGVLFVSDVWEVLERCWTPQPGNRPSIEDVLQCLEQASRSWTPPSRLLAASSITDSLTRRFSDSVAAESMDGNGMSSPSQSAPSQPPEERKSAGITDWAPPDSLGEHTSLLASDSSPTRGPLREVNCTEPNDLGSGDDGAGTFVEQTARPQRKNSNVTLTSVHHQNVVGMAGDVDDAPTSKHRSRVEGEASGWKTIRQGIQRPGAPPRSTSALISLAKIVNWDGKSQGIGQMLTAAFEAEGYLGCIENLRAGEIDPLSYVNSLDKIIDSLPPDSDLRKRCIRALRKTCGLYGILPASYVVPFTLSKPVRRPFSSGGFSDVWKFTEKNNDRAFAVKSLRIYEQDPIERINKKFCKEVVVSKRAKHPNILSIEGVAPELFEFCMVSQWMANGDMPGYVKKYPEVDRLKLLVGVTRGLDYLHNNEIVHGDLKSSNVLIDAEGIPRLHNFGLSSITKNIDSVNASTPNQGCTIRYCAPELLDVGGVVRLEKRKPTNKSDMYSLSMVIVELVTGMMPFPESTDPIVAVLILRGRRPQKPRRFETPGMTPAVWKIAEKCWHQRAKERPEVNTVLQRLENLANSGDTHTRIPLLQRLREVFDGREQFNWRVKRLPSNPST